MTDDHTPQPEDERDERLAALLAVAPLAPHTRGRLIRRALDEAPASTRGPFRWTRVAVAAAVLAVIAVTGAVLLTGGTDHGGPRRALGPGRGPRAVPSPLTLAPSSAAAVPHDLGAVGDVTAPRRLRRVAAGPSTGAGGSVDSVRQTCHDLATIAGLVRLDTVGTGVDGGVAAGGVVGPG